jgi:hypothetical protein
VQQLQNGNLIEYTIKIYKKEQILRKRLKILDWEVIPLPDLLLEDRIPEKLKENHVLVQANPLYY